MPLLEGGEAKINEGEGLKILTPIFLAEDTTKKQD